MKSRYSGKAWDRHFLPRLTTLETKAIPKESALVVLPVGAVEQHGPHMPVFTDTLIGEGFLTEAFEQLPDDAPVWLLPPLPFGKSNEHLNHAGTISLSATTLMAVLTDISSSLKRSGFRKLLLFNTHGGNSDLLNMMAREIRIATGMDVFRLDPGALQLGEGMITEEEKRVGIHAGDTETSVVMALQRTWVNDTLAPKEMPNFPKSSFLQLKSKAFAWITDDISETGIAGDATLATPDKGNAMLMLGGKLLAEAMLEMAAFDMTSLRAQKSTALT
ncbi:creatininase family protein [Paenibacillus rigui]|uniref:Creatininase n=1 Tax=Paenibacillus rigui TaxID=554312 RepID=A0A229UWD3_9BACL|nr:creatininase family protein [Paenibacillus rigui]OXM87762.1 creatininase [Paenibacillus rigui]